MSAETTTRAKAVGRFIDPAAIMQIKNLELRARTIVEGMWKGLHRSPYHGFSVEFSEYRPFIHGDDPRYLDWRLFARSDRYYLRKFEEETNLRCQFVLDLSKSMGFGSVTYNKADYAKTLVGTLAYFLSLQGDASGLTLFADGLQDYIPPRVRSGHLRQVLQRLEKPLIGKDTDVTLPLRKTLELTTRRSLLVFVSDFLADLSELGKSLQQVGASGHEVILLQILDPQEINFTFEEDAMFEDLETGRVIYLDPAAVRDEYKQRFQEHTNQLKQLASKAGMEFVQIPTSEYLEVALFKLLQTRDAKSSAPRRNKSSAR
jgi:uncharacterized protein (DUF58 family)